MKPKIIGYSASHHNKPEDAIKRVSETDWAAKNLENGYKMIIFKNKDGAYSIEVTNIAAPDDLRKDLRYIGGIYPINKAIADYGMVSAPMAAFNQGIQLGLLIALGEVEPMSSITHEKRSEK